ncbi:hypothetical protein ACFO0N_09730 [Halobium salinum]|uniref:PRC-barrel domain-containing protein n=1 Tax=Halobium salinum TaxID=1364940 RepID=A0ABD5PBH1_9EURY|nr:hypothetical protein [Halobium salinum]
MSDPAGDTASETAGAGVDLSEDLVGEHVVGEDGRGVGVVTAVDPDGGRLCVDLDPTLGDGVKAKLGVDDDGDDGDGEGGGSEDDDDGSRWLGPDDIESRDGDRIVVGDRVAAAATPSDPTGAEGEETKEDDRPADASDTAGLEGEETKEDNRPADASDTAGLEGTDDGAASSDSRIDLSEADEGKEVVTDDGEAVGVVADVDPDAGRFSVDSDPDLTDRLAASLFGADDEGERVLDVGSVVSVEGSHLVVDLGADDGSAGERRGDDDRTA